MIKRLLSVSIIYLAIISCQSEIQCNQQPEISVDQSLLQAQIDEIESYLDSEGIDYQTHSSGIRYTVLEDGTGNSPNFCSNATIDFEGSVIGNDETFTDGIGTDISLRTNQVVPGFKIAVSLMNRNADYRFYIPSALLINKGISNVFPRNIPDGENAEFRVRLTNY